MMCRCSTHASVYDLSMKHGGKVLLLFREIAVLESINSIQFHRAMAWSSCSQHQSLLSEIHIASSKLSTSILICIWHSGTAGINLSCSCFFYFIKCFTAYPDFASEGMLVPASAHCHRLLAAYPWCISVRSVTARVFLKLIHLQTDRSSDYYRFPPNIIPFECFRLASGTKSLGIFDEIKWATKMVYEIVPICINIRLGRISSPENILNNQRPLSSLLKWSYPPAKIHNPFVHFLPRRRCFHQKPPG